MITVLHSYLNRVFESTYEHGEQNLNLNTIFVTLVNMSVIHFWKANPRHATNHVSGLQW